MLRKLHQVLSLFTAERPELTGPEIAKAINRPKSTVYRLLGSFTETGFLDQDRETGRYRLGILLALFGDLARHSSSLQRVAFPMLRQLGESTGELATLMVLSGTVGVTIDVMQGYHPLVLPGLLGGHHPLHATAGGKALLAWRPEETLGEYLKLPLKRYTASTITDLAVLKREFAQARKRGYTSVVGEWFDDVVGVAAPVRNHRGEIIAAFTVGCPRSRATPAKMAQLSRAVLLAGESTSRTLGHGLGAGIRLGAPAGRALSGR